MAVSQRLPINGLGGLPPDLLGDKLGHHSCRFFLGKENLSNHFVMVGVSSIADRSMTTREDPEKIRDLLLVCPEVWEAREDDRPTKRQRHNERQDVCIFSLANLMQNKSRNTTIHHVNFSKILFSFRRKLPKPFLFHRTEEGRWR